MTRFSTLALLYMAALLLELALRLTYPRFTIGVFLLVALMVRRGITPAGFFLFLAATTSHFVLIQFPDVANHVNLSIYCNVVLMVGIGYAWIRKVRFPTDEDTFDLVRPLLQTGLVLVYAVAGFHKLNVDFLDAEVSCTRTILSRLSAMSKSELVGLPAALVLAAGILAAGYWLFSRSRWRRHLPVVGAAGGTAVVAFAALVALGRAPGFASPGIRTGILVMSVVIVIWELGGGILLAVPRFQAAVLAFSWAMHATLALVSFVDFGALALALLFTFVPRPWFDQLNRPVHLPVLNRSVHGVHLYFVINILTVAVGYHRPLVAGLLFNLAALVFLWPLVATAVASAPRPAWIGVPLMSRVAPRWMMVFPAVLLLHGLTAYLGLRTVGNFSMYSNLRTEGARSNHLLLGSNPLKIWGYQEDVVEFTRVVDMKATAGRQNHPVLGHRLPVVEFRKLIYDLTEAGATIAMTFEYRGTVYSTPDIVNDPVWRVRARDWEMVLMGFRIIQSEGPNQCRW